MAPRVLNYLSLVAGTWPSPSAATSPSSAPRWPGRRAAPATASPDPGWCSAASASAARWRRAAAGCRRRRPSRRQPLSCPTGHFVCWPPPAGTGRRCRSGCTSDGRPEDSGAGQRWWPGSWGWSDGGQTGLPGPRVKAQWAGWSSGFASFESWNSRSSWSISSRLKNVTKKSWVPAAQPKWIKRQKQCIVNKGEAWLRAKSHLKFFRESATSKELPCWTNYLTFQKLPKHLLENKTWSPLNFSQIKRVSLKYHRVGWGVGVNMNIAFVCRPESLSLVTESA